jgi:hypothetical protein
LPVLQVVEEAAGQADTTPGGQGLGYPLLVKMTVFRILLLPGIDAGDEGLMHLLHELGEENAFHLGADLGLVLALGLRALVLGLILQGRERGQARGPRGAGRQN